MKKPLVRVIKQGDSESKPPSPVKGKKKKKRSIESTIQGWITERRENEDSEDNSRNSQLAAWTTDSSPAEAV